MASTFRTSAIALVSGLLLGLGLAISAMFDPAKVLDFLDIASVAAGGWDPSLAFVMAGGLIVTLPAFQLARRWRQPVAAPQFQTPTAAGIDRKLVLGAALFGIGWGLVGYCPGPALASLAFGATGTIVFALAMGAGMLLHAAFAARSNR